jgi:ethanolaminephosphotransferase
MSSTASNYTIQRLRTGIAVATAALVTILTIAIPAAQRANTTGIWLSFVVVMYGVMMFASSYVEEEHHFWYWVTSGWLGWLSFKK